MDLNQLPNEVLEHVFCHIPCQDLMRTMRIVCRRWNDIIVRRRFQPWKKSYFRYKVGENGRGLIGESDNDDEPPKKKNKKKEPSLQLDLDWKIEELKKAMSNVTSVWNEKINGNQYLHPPKAVNGDADVNFRLEIAAPWLVKFISEEFSQFEKEGNFKQIDKHAKFRMVQEFLQERMPKFAKNDIASIVILCCIANDAWDCEEIIRVLTKPSLRSCSSLDTSEVVYSIALAFLVFHRQYGLPSKWHYNVFHAISFFENEFNAGIEEKKKSSVSNLYYSRTGGQKAANIFGLSVIVDDHVNDIRKVDVNLVDAITLIGLIGKQQFASIKQRIGDLKITVQASLE